MNVLFYYIDCIIQLYSVINFKYNSNGLIFHFIIIITVCIYQNIVLVQMSDSTKVGQHKGRIIQTSDGRISDMCPSCQNTAHNEGKL